MGYIVNIDKYPIGVYRICKGEFYVKMHKPPLQMPELYLRRQLSMYRRWMQMSAWMSYTKKRNWI